MNRHGIAVEGSYGVTVGDIQAIPYITEHYSDVKVRKSNGKVMGIVYALDHVDTTYYVECLTSNRYLDGKQMIKAPLGNVPDAYNDLFEQKRSTSEYPDKAPYGVPGKYVQDVQQRHAFNPNIASTQNAVNRFSENAPKEVNIAAATLGIKPKEAVSKRELKERLQDQHTLDVGMRGMEVRSAKAAEREKARIALAEQKQAHKQELKDTKAAHAQEVKDLKAEHRADKKQQKADLTEKATEEKAAIHRYYKDRDALRKAKEQAAREAKKANSPMGQAMAYFESGLLPEDYMDAAEHFDKRVNKLLRGMWLQAGHDVGGELNHRTMAQMKAFTAKAKHKRALSLSLTSPIRVFENLLPRGQDRWGDGGEHQKVFLTKQRMRL